jgi:hypothetical protein
MRKNNALLGAYALIAISQDEIGDGAKMRLFEEDGALIVRLDWWRDDFHIEKRFSENELKYSARDELVYFLAECKRVYVEKKKSVLK